MSIVVRRPVDDEWPAVCHADGRAFGVTYTEEEIEERRPLHDMSRFSIACDGDQIIGISGSYAMDVTLPGGASVPMGGVTWVSVAATHRRQGLMRRVMNAVHDDIDERGEPLASLYASEGGIYDHLGYGIATRMRTISLDPRSTKIREEHRMPPGTVRYVGGDDVVPVVSEIWDRFRRVRAGETDRDAHYQQYLATSRSKANGDESAVAYLVHRDGYAAYRTTTRWNDGQPAHRLNLLELAAVTPEAHVALWQTLLGIDLVGEITSRCLPLDDPLPFLLENQRALRTTTVNDGVWVSVRDAAICFGARTYRMSERMVVEVDGKRLVIEGGPDGGSCKSVRSRPDLVTSPGWFSALLYGGVMPSTLVAGRQMTARSSQVLDRADMFFGTRLDPHCQSMY